MEANSCPFCKVEREIIISNNTAFAIFDIFPVSEGHVLVVTKRHCANFFELSTQEQMDCIAVINSVHKLVDEQYQPGGFNIGINVNRLAGQTIDHVHIHLIPRYNGDVNDPTGGVRGVIPSKQKY